SRRGCSEADAAVVVGGAAVLSGRSGRACGSVAGVLLAELVAEVLDGVADLAPSLAECFFDMAGGLLGFALVAEVLVVGHLPHRLFDLTADPIGFSAYFVPVPHHPASFLRDRRCRTRAFTARALWSRSRR